MSAEPRVTVVIPFRDRGKDPRRAANLEVVQAWWYAHGFEPHVIDDGLTGSAPFNRHRAYNRAVSKFTETDVYVFTEADMLIYPLQVCEAVTLAYSAPGLVVPFTQYRYLSDENTTWLRDRYHDMTEGALAAWWADPPESGYSVFGMRPQSVMDHGKSIGAVNVVSGNTLGLTGGFTEATSGNWYDDNIIEEGFAFLTGAKTRWVTGPAVHLYHLPGHKGDHLTEEDIKATEHNRILLESMRHDIRLRRRGPVHRLMSKRAKRDQ